MIIKPRTRGFICITAHPTGCAANIRAQIETVQSRGKIRNGPKNVLIIGASTGYGLATRIVSAFACGSATLGVFMHRGSERGRTAEAGWYNSVAFQNAAQEEGLVACNINGDAFSNEIKEKTVDLIKLELGKIDLLVYSLAAPRRIDPYTGEVYKSALKPVGRAFTSKGLDTDRGVVKEVTFEPATEEEIEGTTKVMGGEDWKLWIESLRRENLLAEGCSTCAYSYIGPEVTWPVYRNGTIGIAKKHIEDTAEEINQSLKSIGGRAFTSVNKAFVSHASSAIPVVPLYISILFKVMKEKGIHEECIEQIYRLFNTHIYGEGETLFDKEGRVRIDDLEMRSDIQKTATELWNQVTTENLDEISDFAGYRSDFLKLFGFGIPGVDYEADVDPVVEFST